MSNFIFIFLYDFSRDLPIFLACIIPFERTKTDGPEPEIPKLRAPFE